MATGRSFGDFVTRRSQLLGKRLTIVGFDRYAAKTFQIS